VHVWANKINFNETSKRPWAVVKEQHVGGTGAGLPREIEPQTNLWLAWKISES
jgi:hypothetical protein